MIRLKYVGLLVAAIALVGLGRAIASACPEPACLGVVKGFQRRPVRPRPESQPARSYPTEIQISPHGHLLVPPDPARPKPGPDGRLGSLSASPVTRKWATGGRGRKTDRSDIERR